MQSTCGHKTFSPHDSSSMNAIRFISSHTSQMNFIQTFQWTFPRHPYHAFMHKQQLDISLVSSQLHLAMKKEQKAASLNSSYDHNTNHTAIPFKLFASNYSNNVIHICRVKRNLVVGHMILRGNNVLQTLTKGTATEYNAVCFQAKQRSPGMMFAFARKGFTQAILCEIMFNITWKFQQYFFAPSAFPNADL